MAEFKFKSARKVLSIEGREYAVDAGNKEQLKRFMAKVKALDDLASGIQAADGSAEVVDQLVTLEREVIEATIGDWDRLWECAEGNVFGMLALVRYITEEITSGMKDGMKAYGL